MSAPWNTSARVNGNTNRHSTLEAESAPRPRLHVEMEEFWRKKMDEIEAKIQEETSNLGVIDREVRLKDMERKYLEIKLQRLTREQEKLQQDSELEKLNALVNLIAAKLEELKKDDLEFEQNGFQIVDERVMIGALKRKLEAAQAEVDEANAYRHKIARMISNGELKAGRGLFREASDESDEEFEDEDEERDEDANEDEDGDADDEDADEKDGCLR